MTLGEKIKISLATSSDREKKNYFSNKNELKDIKMEIKRSLNGFVRFSILLVLYYVLFISGKLSISGLMPDIISEPGIFCLILL